MSRKTPMEILKRYIILVIGLVIMSFGVAFSINAQLGTSPTSSIPYVASLFSRLSVGKLSIIMNVILIMTQILVLRKRYKIIQLLQLPVAIAVGYMIDYALLMTSSIMPSTYWQQWLLCLFGILLVAVGVSLEVMANEVMLSGEGLVLAICQVTHAKFGNIKVIIDVALVVLAVALSFIVLHGLQGVREGTVAAAILVGLFSKWISRLLAPLERKIFPIPVMAESRPALGVVKQGLLVSKTSELELPANGKTVAVNATLRVYSNGGNDYKDYSLPRPLRRSKVTDTGKPPCAKAVNR